MSNLSPNCCLKVDFQKVAQHAGGKWLIHDTKRRMDNQLQSLKLPCRIPSWVARCDIKGSDGTMLNPIFWKNVQRQKHPGRWEIAEHQIPNIKKLFKTNTKGHKHPSIRLFIKGQDTIGKPKKTKSSIQPRNRALPRNSPIICDGVQLLNNTPVVCLYTSYNRTHIKNAYIYIYIYL